MVDLILSLHFNLLFFKYYICTYVLCIKRKKERPEISIWINDRPLVWVDEFQWMRVCVWVSGLYFMCWKYFNCQQDDNNNKSCIRIIQVFSTKRIFLLMNFVLYLDIQESATHTGPLFLVNRCGDCNANVSGLWALPPSTWFNQNTIFIETSLDLIQGNHWKQLFSVVCYIIHEKKRWIQKLLRRQCGYSFSEISECVWALSQNARWVRIQIHAK